MTGSLTKIFALITSVVVATGDSASHSLRASNAIAQPPNSGPVPGPPPPPMLRATTDVTTPCRGMITQSTSQTITTGIFPCLISHPPPGGNIQSDNSFWRAFNMPSFVGRRTYFVNSVSFGVSSTNIFQSVQVRLYTNNAGAFPGGTRDLIGTTTVNVTPTQSGTVVRTPLIAVVPAGTNELVMELYSPSSPGVFVMGSNSATETGPSYRSSPCGMSTPVPTSEHIVFNVYGSCATQWNN